MQSITYKRKVSVVSDLRYGLVNKMFIFAKLVGQARKSPQSPSLRDLCSIGTRDSYFFIPYLLYIHSLSVCIYLYFVLKYKIRCPAVLLTPKPFIYRCLWAGHHQFFYRPCRGHLSHFEKRAHGHMSFLGNFLYRFFMRLFATIHRCGFLFRNGQSVGHLSRIDAAC